jgi:hypothetical protein
MNNKKKKIEALSKCAFCGCEIKFSGVSANGFLYCSDNCCYSHAKKINKPVWYA